MIQSGMFCNSDYSVWCAWLVDIFSWSGRAFVQLGVVQWSRIISGRGGGARRGAGALRLTPVPGCGLRSTTGCASFTLIREKNKRRPHARMKAKNREAAPRLPCFMVDCCGTGATNRDVTCQHLITCNYVISLIRH